MKRKRGARRKPPNKSPAAPASAGPANPGFLNDENSSHFDRDNGVDSRMKSGSALGGNNTSHHLEERFLGEVDTGNSIQTSNLMAKVASFAAKLSRAVGSPSAEPTNNSPAVHDDIMQEVEPELSESDHLNNEKELNEALSVIRKIMKMESAKPFNLPVDPTALGIPDYLEIIEKPMDFGTVCNNIEWGGKYRNSKDVYTDVQLIWNNCARYNKKGDYILDLMRRVKTNFEKLWNAAGLFSEELEVEDEANLKNATERPTKTSKDGNTFPSGSVISKSIQQEKRQDVTGLLQVQAQKSLPCFSHTQSQHLSPDHQGEWQSLECQSLQPPRNGHLPTAESTMGDKLRTYTRRGGHNNVTNNSQQQDENRPRKELSHQPSASHAPKSHPNERPYKYSQQQDDNRPWKEPSHQPSASHGSRIHLNERPYTYSQQQVENRPRKELSHQPSASHGSRIHLNERPYTTYSQQQDENRPRKELSHQPSVSHASKFYPNERPCEYQPRSSNHHYTSNPAAANTHSAGHFHGVPSSSAWESREYTRVSVPAVSHGNNQKHFETDSGHFHKSQSLLRYDDQYQPHHKSYGHLLDSSETLNAELDARDLVEEVGATNNMKEWKNLDGVFLPLSANLRNLSSFDPEVTDLSDPQMLSPVESTVRHVKSKLGHPITPVTSHSRQQQFQNGLNEAQPPSTFFSHSNRIQEKNSQLHSDMRHPEIPQPLDRETTSRAAPAESTARRSKSQPTISLASDDYSDDDVDEECQAGPSESHSPSNDSYQPIENAAQKKPSLSSAAVSTPQDQLHCTGTSLAWPLRGRGRGPSNALKWLHEETRIVVFTNELGQAVGPNAPKLITFLGILSRNGHLAPLTHVDWRAVPKENKDKLWKEVQAKFIMDPDSKKWVIQTLGRKWKDWKAKLKLARYSPHTTDEERLADRDERVLPDQWEYLVSHWSSEQAEIRSSRNRASRSKQRYRHATGSKSHARIREEQRAKRPDGKPPSRAELFILTRTRKDGKPVNEESSAVIVWLSTKLGKTTKQLHERANEQNTAIPGQVNLDDDEVLCQIIGRNKHGRVSCKGLGPSPAELAEVNQSKAEAAKLVIEARSEISGVKDRLAAMEQTCAQMAQQMSTMMSMMSTMQKTSREDDHVPSQVGDAPETSEALPDQQVQSTSLRRSGRTNV